MKYQDSSSRPQSSQRVWLAKKVAIRHALCVIASLLFFPSASTLAQPPSRPSHWGIIVGVPRCDSEKLGTTPGADAAASRVAEWLERTASWQGSHVLRLTGTSRNTPVRSDAPIPEGGLAPTRANLEWALSEWYASRARPGDVLLFYFAGKATRLDDTRITASQQGSVGLVPVDAQPDSPDGNAFSLVRELSTWAKRGFARTTVVCWLDLVSPVIRTQRGETFSRGWIRNVALGPSGDLNRAGWPEVIVWSTDPSDPRVSIPTAGGLADAAIRSMGDPADLMPLSAGLRRLRLQPEATGLGLRAAGSIAPGWSLWPAAHAATASRRPAELVLQRGHSDGVNGLIFTSDGERAVSTSSDASVRVWRAADGALLRSFHDSMVGTSSPSLSDDQSRLFWVGLDGRGYAAELEGKGGIKLVGPNENLISGGFVPGSGGRLIFTLGDAQGGEQRLRAWELDVKGSYVARAQPLLENGRKCVSLVTVPLGRSISALAVDEESKIHAFDRSAKAVWTADGPPNSAEVTAFAVTADGRKAAVGDSAGRVAVLEIGDSAPGRWLSSAQAFAGEDAGAVVSLAFAQEGWLAAAAGKQVCTLSGERDVLQILSRLRSELSVDRNVLAIASDGRSMAFTSQGRLYFAVRDGGQPLSSWRYSDLPAPIRELTVAAVCFGPESDTLVVGDTSGSVAWLSLNSTGRKTPATDAPKVSLEIVAERGRVKGLDVSGDRHWMLQVTEEGVAQIWDLKAGQARDALPGRHAAGVFAGDSERLLFLDRVSGDPLLTDLEGTPVPGQARFERPVTGPGGKASRERFQLLAKSSDGEYVVAAGGRTAVAWRSRVGGQPFRFDRLTNGGPISSIAVSPDGSHLFLGCVDGWVRCEPLAAQEGSTWELRLPNGVSAMAVSVPGPTSKPLVVFGLVDGRLMLIDADRGKTAPTLLTSLAGRINAIAFGPDQRSLLVGTSASPLIARVQLGADLAAIGSPDWLGKDGSQSGRHGEQVRALRAFPGGQLLASGSDDTTVRLWSLTTGEALCAASTLPRSRDWIVFSPEGQFDGSAEGRRRRVAIRLGGELDAIALDRVFDKLMRFGLLAEVARGERPKAPIRLDSLSEARPPALNVTVGERTRGSPANLVRLRVEATDQGAGVGDVRCFKGRSGYREKSIPVERLATVARSRASDLETKVFEFSTLLREGDNPIWVTASSAGINRESDPFTITIPYDRPKLPAPRLFVICVGIKEYKETTFPKLLFPVADARAVAEVFERRGRGSLYQEARVEIILDRDATRTSIINRIRELGSHTGPQDTFVLYLSGHGVTLTEPDSSKSHSEQYYFVTVDVPGVSGVVDPEGLRQNGISASELLRAMAGISAENIALILDTCYSGAASLALRRESLEPQQRLYGGVIVASSADSLKSYEDPVLGQGVFTYCFLSGLNALRRDPFPTPAISPPRLGEHGGVIIRDLFRYALFKYDHVIPKIVKVDQSPQMFGDRDDFELVTYGDGGNPPREDTRPGPPE